MEEGEKITVNLIKTNLNADEASHLTMRLLKTTRFGAKWNSDVVHFFLFVLFLPLKNFLSIECEISSERTSRQR